MPELWMPEPRTQRIITQPDNPLTILRVELTENLATGGSATAKRVDFRWDDDENEQLYIRGDAEIEVYDALKRCLGFGPVSPNQTGERLQVMWQPDSLRWEVIGEHGLRRRGKTTAAHNEDANGDVTIWTGPKGSEVSTGVTVSARNLFANLSSSGIWVWLNADYNGDDIVWYLTAADC
jgi:hypothetical protein